MYVLIAQIYNIQCCSKQIWYHKSGVHMRSENGLSAYVYMLSDNGLSAYVHSACRVYLTDNFT